MMKTTLRIGFSLLLAAGALWPAARDAIADDDVAEAPARVVLRKIPNDATVLINVAGYEMPSSPDILNLGRRATAALERCLSDNTDAGLRVVCARVLNDLGDPRALPTLRTALDDWEEPVRYEVARALVSLPDAASYDALAKVYRRKDESERVKSVVLSALGALGQQKAVRFLRGELAKVPKKDEADSRAEVFRALWQSRSLMARTTLVGDTVLALKSGNQALVYAGVEAATELRDRALSPALVPLMDHVDAEIRNKAVYALGHIGDPAATRALLAHLPKVRESRMLNNIAFALERLDRKAFYAAIDKVAQHKQAIIRLNAAFVVGDVRRPEGLPILERSAKDASDLVRTSSVAALGKLDTAAAVPVAEKYVSDPNWSIRQEAVYAISALTKGQKKDLIHDQLFAGKLPRDGEAIRRRAAIALGELGDARVRDYLMTCYEQRACALGDVEAFLEADKDVSVSSRLLLGWAQGRHELTDLLGVKSPTGAGPLALSSFDQARSLHSVSGLRRSADFLGYVGAATATKSLSAVRKDASTWTRLHVLVASARLGDAAAVKQVLAELDNAPQAWMSRIVRIISRVREPKARQAFTAELTTRARGADADHAMAAAAVLLAWDPDPQFFLFLDALGSASPRKQALARRYLLRERSKKVTWLMRRALARESRSFVRDELRVLLDDRS